MKNLKKVIAFALCLVTLFSVMSISVSAARTKAFDFLTTSNYAKTYALSSSGKTIPYTNANLTTRGSITYGKSSTAYIDNKSDELYLCDVGKNSKGTYWAKVSYPVGSKRAYAYIALSAITGNNGTHAKSTASGKFYCSYRKGVSTSSNYYVAKGDTVYLIAVIGNNYQIMYPISGGKWRIGWCSKINYDKYCSSKSNTPTNNSKSNSQNNSSTNIVSTKSSKTYSVSNNILTVNGVKMSEFTVGGKYTDSRYVTINGKKVDMCGWECCGYARYIQYKLYGSHYKLNPSKFPNLPGSENVYPNASGYKKLITSAGVGAHIRTLGNGHSMIVIAVTSTGFTVTDANSDWNNTIKVKTYTWEEYSNSTYGKRGLDYIEIYKK